MNITILEDLDLSQIGRTSKYRWLYDMIELLEVGGVIEIEADTIKEVTLYRNAIVRTYPQEVNEREIVLNIRKYGKDGRYSPTLFISRLEKG